MYKWNYCPQSHPVGLVNLHFSSFIVAGNIEKYGIFLKPLEKMNETSMKLVTDIDGNYLVLNNFPPKKDFKCQKNNDLSFGAIFKLSPGIS